MGQSALPLSVAAEKFARRMRARPLHSSHQGMSPFDDDIDGLYRLPPEVFTEARNRLATRAGGDAGKAIRALVKPQLAAWAVNQVYWRDRVAFDRLVKAAEGVRAAHRRLVSGEAADVAGAERAHHDALSQAMARARAALEEIAQPVSPAVLAAVADTLRALPTADPFGRLAKPLAPTSGFDAFAGVVPRAPSGTARTAPPPLRLQKGAGTAKAAARDAARERARVEKELASAAAKLTAAQTALTSLTRALESAARERDKRQAALDDAEARLDELSAQLSRARQAVENAAHERDRLKRRVEALGS